MKIRIVITTCLWTVGYFNWKEVQEWADDDEKERVQSFIDADEDDRYMIAREIVEDYCSDKMIVDPYLNIEVEYPNEEYPDEDHSSVEVTNNWKDAPELYEKEIENIEENEIFILKEEGYKRCYFEKEIESDKPFNLDFLSVMDGEIHYGSEEIEWSGDGEGMENNVYVYVAEKYKVEEEETDDQEDDDNGTSKNDSTPTSTGYYAKEHAEQKLNEILKPEIDAWKKHEEQWLKKEHELLFRAWKEVGIPDKGEQDWWDSDLWLNYKDYVNVDEKKIAWFKKKEKTDDPQYLQLSKMKGLAQKWENAKKRIDQENQRQVYHSGLLHVEGGWVPLLEPYRDEKKKDVIDSWGEHTRERILSKNKQLHELYLDAKKKKFDFWKSKGYPMLNSGYDFHADDWEEKHFCPYEVTDIEDVWEEYSIEVYMNSIGKTDKDSDEIESLKEECEEVFEAIDDWMREQQELIYNDYP